MLFYRIDAFDEKMPEENGAEEEKGEESYARSRRSERAKARELQLKMNEFNARFNGKTYFCPVENDDGKLLAAAITENRKEMEDNFSGFFKVWGVVDSKVSAEEITLQDLTNLLSGAARNGFIRDEDDVMEMFGLDAVYGNARRLFRSADFGENMIPEKSREDIVAQIEKTLYAETLLPEIDRIYAVPAKNGFFGHPCHYVMMTVDDEDVRRDTYRALLSALYANGRLYSKRYWYMDAEPSDLPGHRELNRMFSTCRGGTIIVRVKPGDDSEDNSYASAMRELANTYSRVIREWQNDVLTILCIPYECERTRDMFYEYLGNVNFIECREELARGDVARHYLQALCREKHVRPTKKLYEKMDDNFGYRTNELRTIFEDWYNARLKTVVFPQYKDVSRTAAAVAAEGSCGSAYERLMALVGLENAKKVINQAKDYFAAQTALRDKGFKNDRPMMSMVFTGNPGSCKTTVARLVAEIFRDLGILSEGKLVECGRGDLVGKYVGWTAQQVKKKFREAHGSVLFIDEAYSLVDDRDGSFGDEAINTITQEMENARDDVLVIFAGYPDKMENFLRKNPGLRSRIAFHVHFDDYNADELCDISKMIAQEKGLVLSDAALDKMHGVYQKLASGPDFGNGRAARNIVESAKMAMASRLMKGDVAALTKEQVVTVLPEDIDMPVMGAAPEKRAVGF